MQQLVGWYCWQHWVCGALERKLSTIPTGNGCSHAKVTAGVGRRGMGATLFYDGAALGMLRQERFLRVFACGSAGVWPTDMETQPMQPSDSTGEGNRNPVCAGTCAPEKTSSWDQQASRSG